MSSRLPVPPLLRRRSSDEYRPLAWRRADREARSRFGDAADEQARRAGLAPTAYVDDRRGTAATLRAIDAAAGGGGLYTVPADAIYGVDLHAARTSRDAGREWLEAARRELGACLA